MGLVNAGQLLHAGSRNSGGLNHRSQGLSNDRTSQCFRPSLQVLVWRALLWASAPLGALPPLPPIPPLLPLSSWLLGALWEL